MERSGVGHVILGALRRGPRSGYEIKALVDRSTRFFWAASYGQIYPELRRLEEEGLILGKNEPRGERPRRVYRLTARGRRALRAWLLAPRAAYEVRDEGLLKLFFADALDGEEAAGLVRAIRADRQAVLDRLVGIQAGKKRPLPSFPSLVLEYGIERHRWEVDWLAGVERRLAHETAGADAKEVV
jgi:PadR family transcriptional regulator, regulatory protein AphA